MKEFLYMSGLTFWVLVCLVILGVLVGILRVLAEKYRAYRRYKNRFKKKPIAKCHCIDCINYMKDGKCRYSVGTVADCWFCNRAEPRKK